MLAACTAKNSSSLRQQQCMIFESATVAFGECDLRWLTEPRAVCIGPYTRQRYHGVARLDTMQNHKWLCAGRLIYDRKNPSDSGKIRRCLETIKVRERRIRATYFEELRWSSDELILTILLDACFILFLLMLHADPREEQFDDYRNEELGDHQIQSMVKHDLLLFGNQIPFFVIRALCTVIMPGMPHESLVGGALQLFSTIWHCKPANSMSVRCDQVLHLLHLFYLSVIPDSQRDEEPRARSLHRPFQGIRVLLPPATVLDRAGIRLGPRDNACSFLDVKFSNGVLLIPPLQVDGNTVIVLGSLIAFEKLHCRAPDHVVVTYVSFLKQLLTGPDDSRLLQKRGIIRNMTTAHKTSIFSFLFSDGYHVPCNSDLTDSFMDTTEYYGRRRLWSFKSPIVGPLMLVLAIFIMILSSYRVLNG